ncbi:lysophospholipid acyltransferase family protein [Zafaria sp. J156]|uniref:lysophospholipid acyltransferase family protein n=1 Tax=Zafaria sp. J156 TaxID=3116490 RepID=UPI002E764896|nr:lysophospholipid acyltransferase family protein [Zafaria sp. J156]MEE1620750.1 lysophospholipid acyltransferase family protein [Zafaria sp. J156]
MTETFGARAVFAVVAGIARPALNLMMGRTWERFDALPEGGFIACPNHVTEIDPLVVGHAFYNHGRLPRYLAKESLFKVPVVGAVLRATRQIPVARSTVGAQESLALARQLIDEGSVAIVYPEGTLTRDPEEWPMRGRTGAARLALQTGAPVVPIAHWGAQQVLPRYGKSLKIWPRKRVRVRVGDPVDLSDLMGRPVTRTVLEEATSRIIAAVTAEVAVLRGAEPPAKPWDPAVHGQKATGRDFGAAPTDGEQA